MLKSMTGFGKAVCEFPQKNVIIEVKSLNSKQLDLNVKLPYLFKEKEINYLSPKRIRPASICFCWYASFAFCSPVDAEPPDALFHLLSTS